MAITINAKLGNILGKKGMVVSHERSGTHFLMNTLALNFGYIAKPWINFDGWDEGPKTEIVRHSPDAPQRGLRGSIGPDVSLPQDASSVRGATVTLLLNMVLLGTWTMAPPSASRTV